MTSNIARTFEETLQRHGLSRALAFLNGTTPYRFTGVYRFQDGVVKSVLLYDRKNPELRIGENVPWNDSYCRITADSGNSCTIEESLTDERLLHHAARYSVQAYCAVLLRMPTGLPLGTLCHFDVTPHHAPREILETLNAVRNIVERELWMENKIAVSSEKLRKDLRRTI